MWLQAVVLVRVREIKLLVLAGFELVNVEQGHDGFQVLWLCPGDGALKCAGKLNVSKLSLPLGFLCGAIPVSLAIWPLRLLMSTPSKS